MQFDDFICSSRVMCIITLFIVLCFKDLKIYKFVDVFFAICELETVKYYIAYEQ